MQELHVTANEAGQRLDKHLAKFLNQAPKSFLYKMMRKTFRMEDLFEIYMKIS